MGGLSAFYALALSTVDLSARRAMVVFLQLCLIEQVSASTCAALFTMLSVRGLVEKEVQVLVGIRRLLLR